MTQILKLNHNDLVTVLNDALNTGKVVCKVGTLTVNTKKQKNVDLRLYVELGDEIPSITPDSRGSIELGSSIRFGESLMKWYSREFSASTYIVKTMWFHFNNERFTAQLGENFVDVRLRKVL